MQISIHDHHSVASGMFQASGHGDLMAKIPGEGHNPHPVLSSLEPLQQAKGAIPAAVIHVEDFKAARGLLVHDVQQSFMGLTDDRFLVEAGNDNGAERRGVLRDAQV